ncbi:MAG: hypothetical protein QOI98_2787 [Solirubrobacteraceae bacterium]|nr:hypothetical protein [Solirubrobacteraceae bacterium]
MLCAMHTDTIKLSDRQARAAILAAEAVGFEREPDLYPATYDHDLHEDGRIAAAFLRARDPSRLAAALASDEPIAARCAAWRITESGRFTMADADAVLEAAVALGFEPPRCDLPLLPSSLRWAQARAAVAYFWEHDADRLAVLIGDAARIAPLPDSARVGSYGCEGNLDTCRCAQRDEWLEDAVP